VGGLNAELVGLVQRFGCDVRSVRPHDRAPVDEEALDEFRKSAIRYNDASTSSGCDAIHARIARTADSTSPSFVAQMS